MLNNKYKNEPCQFAEQIVGCLYGEIDAKEKSKFQSHIENCSACADEFADFSFVRASVLEWREKEFLNLEQPVFKFPLFQKSAVETKNESNSWIGEIKKFFVFRPALAAAAFGILIVFVGLTFIALNFSKSNDLAEIDRKDSKKTVASPTAERVVSQPTDKSSEKTAEEVNKTVATETIQQPQTTSVKSTVKTSNRADSEITPVRESRDKKIRDKKSPPTVKQQVPNLNEMDEDEDKTIRLADLFEEIGTE